MAEDLIITLGLKDQGARKQITGLNKELRMLDKEFKATTKGSNTFEQGTSKLSKQLGILENKYKANEAKVKAYKQVMNETKEALAKKKAELEKLTNAENVNEKAVEKCKTQISNMEQTLNKTAREINLTEQEMQELEQQIKSTQTAINNKPYEDARQKLNELGAKAQETGEKLQNIGESMNNAGNALLKMSTPIVAFGAYATKATMDFEEGMAKVQAISGATSEELEQLKEKAREMGEKTKFSATESAEALQYMSMAGWKTNQMLTGLEGIMNLSAASGESLALVSDIVTDALTAFGMKAEESGKFADILASASSNANTNVAMMGETFKYVAPVAGAMKYSAEDTAVAIGLMANSGIKASQAGTSLRQVLMGLQGGVEVAIKGAKKYHVEVENADGTMRKFSDVIKDLRHAFSLMTDAQKASNAESIAGKVGMSGLLAIVNASEADFNKLTKAVENSAGKSKEMADIMNKTAKGQLTLLKSKLESLGISIGERLLPHINKLIDGVGKIVDWFANLSEGTQNAIMQFGLFTAGSGLALKAVGSLTKGLGSLVKSGGSAIKFMAKYTKETSLLNKASKIAAGTNGIKGVVGAMKLLAPAGIAAAAGIAAVGVGIKLNNAQTSLLSKNVLTAKEDLTGFEKVAAKLNGTNFKSREELEKLGLVYKDFGENISKEFQDAVKSSQKSITDFTASLHEISFDNALSKDEIKNFNDTVKDMCSTAINTIREKQKESNQAMSDMFKLDDGKIDEQEKKVLAILQKSSENQISEIQKLEKEIYAIKDGAVKAKRGLDDQEIANIEAKTARIKELELEALGTTQEEVLFAKNEFAARVQEMDLESASTLMQEKAKKRDEEIVQIQASYDTQLQLLENKLLIATESEKTAIEEQIVKHTEARDKKIEAERLLYDELLCILWEKNPQLLNEINKYTGEVLSIEDKKAQSQQEQYMSNFAELQNITQSGTYNLYNQHSGMWEKVSVTVDSRTGEVIGAYADMHKKAGGYSSAMAKNNQDLASKIGSSSKEMAKDFLNTSKANVTSSNDIVTANGKVVTSLEDVKKNADGTKEGIIKLNGTPVKIEVNKDGTITNLNEIKTAINNIPTFKSVTVKVNKQESVQAAPQQKKKNISVPQIRGFEVPQVSSFSLPTNYGLPKDYSNIITDPYYYTKANPVVNSVITNNYHNNKSIKNNTNSLSALNLDELGDIIANAVANAVSGALSNLKIENNINAKVNNKNLIDLVDQGTGLIIRQNERRLGK